MKRSSTEKLVIVKELSYRGGNHVVKVSIELCDDHGKMMNITAYEPIAAKMESDTLAFAEWEGIPVERTVKVCPHFLDETCPVYLHPFLATELMGEEYKVCTDDPCGGYEEGDWDLIFDEQGIIL